ncbi:hypothetical protein ACFQ0M_39545 [Kitasatospora aburaviensis]
MLQQLFRPRAVGALPQGFGVLLLAVPGDPGEVVHLGRRRDERRRPGAQDALCVAALLPRDGGGRGHFVVQGPEVFALAVEAFEALGQFGDLALAERGRARESREDSSVGSRRSDSLGVRSWSRAVIRAS